ncbi:hypothetical protein B0A55_05947 [Friedmanniomyces simplex]|uniref:Uncharacterized protein n=1 Tax=Friedmanniomyces simplex TaxID=329884 RepID=A0A4U0XCE6_9PEZI|nr:hypothetical protein B0A55_05947 [Friedmanniomyces simplex]
MSPQKPPFAAISPALTALQAPVKNTEVSPPSVPDTEMMRTSSSVATIPGMPHDDKSPLSLYESMVPLFAHESPPNPSPPSSSSKTPTSSIPAPSTTPTLPHQSPVRPARSRAENSARAILARLPGLEKYYATLSPAERARHLYNKSFNDTSEYLAWMYEHPEDLEGVEKLSEAGERMEIDDRETEGEREEELQQQGRQGRQVVEGGKGKGKGRRGRGEDGDGDVGPRGEWGVGAKEQMCERREGSRVKRLRTRLGRSRRRGEAVRDEVMEE